MADDNKHVPPELLVGTTFVWDRPKEEPSAPTPEEDLKENTNVETKAIEKEIDEAGPVPEASDIEISGEPTPVSSPNPEPGKVKQP